MPNTREKLIELLRIPTYIKCGDAVIGERKMPIDQAEGLADHLIANGVTIPVRCKDCKHIETIENSIPYCTWNCSGCGYDDFCSYGERREGE